MKKMYAVCPTIKQNGADTIEFTVEEIKEEMLKEIHKKYKNPQNFEWNVVYSQLHFYDLVRCQFDAEEE